jgi:hypothetical protein
VGDHKAGLTRQNGPLDVIDVGLSSSR